MDIQQIQTTPRIRPLAAASAAAKPAAAKAAGLGQDVLVRSAEAAAAHQPSDIAKAVAPFVASPLRAGNKMDLYVDGKEAFAEIYKQIGSAKHRIDLEFFTFHDDPTGHLVADKLVGKAKEGVEVNVLVDKIANRHNSAVLDKMRDSGIRVRDFTNGHRYPMLHPSDITDHRKILLVDGKSAMSGGMNIGERYEKYWHDFMTKMEGPSVQDYYSRFEMNWKLSGGKALRPTTLEKAIKGTHAAQVAVTSPLEHEIRDGQLAAFKSAKKYIIANSPYFIDADYVDALKGAAKRGVKVTAVMPTIGDNPFVDLMNAEVTNELKSAGVRVYHYDTLNKAIGKHNHITDHFNHGKVATVDGVWSAIGTANADTRSMLRNQEIMAFVDSKEFTKNLERRIFGNDMRHKVATTATVELSGLNKVAAKLLKQFRPLF